MNSARDSALPLVQLDPRPGTLYLSQGRTVLATGLDGFVEGEGDQGFFVHETRLLSRFRYTIDGHRPRPVALSNVAQHSWLGYYILRPPDHDPGEPDAGSGLVEEASQHTLELRLSRYVGAALHEDVDLTNYTRKPTSFTLELELDADFADLDEVRSRKRQQAGERTVAWEPGEGGGTLSFDYRAEHGYEHQGERGTARLWRGVRLAFAVGGAPPTWNEGRLSFQVGLEPGATWHACVHVTPLLEGHELGGPEYGCYGGELDTPWDRLRSRFLRAATAFESSGTGSLAPLVAAAMEASKRDLAALRLYDLDHGPERWTMAAGLPIYIALFGRDVLTAAWQMALAGPEAMAGSLEELARWQGRERNDWRDEDPGRMLHEAHTGPLEVLNYNPRARYYGSITTSPAYAVVLSEYWHWTGDLDTVRRLAPYAMRAVRWMDAHGDLDGDGFYEYLSRSEQGTRHQGWKDSGDAIVHEDGSDVAPPIAVSEEQGFAYLAKRQMAELLFWLDERDVARRLWREASELKRRFNDRFWMDDAGFYAMGLDSAKRQIRSIGSNAAHCVATEVVARERVVRTVDRLFAADMFSGWGIRTLSADHPAYNPYSYHRGSVWPVEQAAFALGFRRFDLPHRVNELAHGQFQALALFAHHRLPEVFSGHARERRSPFPAVYPLSNTPQAWSSSAVLCLVQAMLGLYPYAPLRVLIVDPCLPPWLPELTLRGLRVGDARVSLRFRRKPSGKTVFEVLDKRGKLFVLRQASPWSLTETWPGRIRDALASLLPW